MEGLFNVSIFALFAVLWAVFAGALILSQGSLDQAWEWIRGLPLILRAAVWLLFLPVVAGLWIWESNWPLAIRLTLVLGLGFVNLITFFPRYLIEGRA